jgi:hypothetical protein
MIDFLDGQITPPNEAFSRDFSNAFTIDGTYTYKLHPQLAVRANLSTSFLRSDGDGLFVPRRPAGLPDSILTPSVSYTRDFDVDLITLEASALYYVSDAAVSEFQPYIGGGFTLGVPHATYKVTQIVASESDEYFTQGDVFAEFEEDKWSAEAGVHGILGALYYFNSTFAITLEGRAHILQSKFPVETINEDGVPEKVKFDVDYSGFVLSAGAVYSF